MRVAVATACRMMKRLAEVVGLYIEMGSRLEYWQHGTITADCTIYAFHMDVRGLKMSYLIRSEVGIVQKSAAGVRR